MTTEQVVREFVNGATKGKASSLRIEGDKLFNYNTVIAQRINGVLVVNRTKYSMTTTKHQSRIARYGSAEINEGVPMGAQDLTRYMA